MEIQVEPQRNECSMSDLFERAEDSDLFFNWERAEEYDDLRDRAVAFLETEGHRLNLTWTAEGLISDYADRI